MACFLNDLSPLCGRKNEYVYSPNKDFREYLKEYSIADDEINFTKWEMLFSALHRCYKYLDTPLFFSFFS